MEIREGKTTPPKHFTEDTLLQSMETAGADEMPEDAERKGLGTPATRAGIIEKLVRIGFLERKGDKKAKYLIPTHKGISLITVMPEQIQSASMTADWEEKLKLIEQKHYSGDDFMDEIVGMISSLVKTYEVVKDADVLMPRENKKIGKCPLCGKDVVERPKSYSCSDRSCKFALWKNDRYFAKIGKTMNEFAAKQLLAEGKVSLKGCISSKTGKKYNATVWINVEENGKYQFSMEFERGGKNA